MKRQQDTANDATSPNGKKIKQDATSSQENVFHLDTPTNDFSNLLTDRMRQSTSKMITSYELDEIDTEFVQLPPSHNVATHSIKMSYKKRLLFILISLTESDFNFNAIDIASVDESQKSEEDGFKFVTRFVCPHKVSDFIVDDDRETVTISYAPFYVAQYGIDDMIRAGEENVICPTKWITGVPYNSEIFSTCLGLLLVDKKTHPILHGALGQAPETLLLVCDNGKTCIQVLDAQNGNKLRSIRTPNSPSVLLPITRDGSLTVFTSASTLVTYESKDKELTVVSTIGSSSNIFNGTKETLSNNLLVHNGKSISVLSSETMQMITDLDETDIAFFFNTEKNELWTAHPSRKNPTIDIHRYEITFDSKVQDCPLSKQVMTLIRELGGVPPTTFQQQTLKGKTLPKGLSYFLGVKWPANVFKPEPLSGVGFSATMSSGKVFIMQKKLFKARVSLEESSDFTIDFEKGFNDETASRKLSEFLTALKRVLKNDEHMHVRDMLWRLIVGDDDDMLLSDSEDEETV